MRFRYFKRKMVELSVNGGHPDQTLHSVASALFACYPFRGFQTIRLNDKHVACWVKNSADDILNFFFFFFFFVSENRI